MVTRAHVLAVMHDALTSLLCYCCMQALGVALKLTFQGDNQLFYIQFYVFLVVRPPDVQGAVCCDRSWAWVHWLQVFAVPANVIEMSLKSDVALCGRLVESHGFPP